MVNVNEGRMIKEFIELVKINSPSKEEKEISHHLKDKLQSLGLYVIEDMKKFNETYSAGNLICNLKGDEAISPLLFTAHMDTVDVKEQVVPHIDHPYIRTDGRTILGADNKVAIVVFLETIRLLKEHNIKHGPLQFVFTVAEETGLNGAKLIDQSLLKANFGYALDHTGPIGHFVTKAMYYYEVEVCLKLPSIYKNQTSAIKLATKIIKKMELGQIDEETSINLKQFSGNVDAKDLYDYVMIDFEINSFDEDVIFQEIDRLKDIVNKTGQAYRLISYVESKAIYNGFSFAHNDDVVQTIDRAVKVLNYKRKYLKTKNNSDANVFTTYGIPTVNVAVDYEHIHTNQERYNLNNFSKLTKLVLEIIKQVR